MTRWRYAAATDIGLVRQSNQDALFADDKIAIIADGMGGHAAGGADHGLALGQRGFFGKGNGTRPLNISYDITPSE